MRAVENQCEAPCPAKLPPGEWPCEKSVNHIGKHLTDGLEWDEEFAEQVRTATELHRSHQGHDDSPIGWFE
jgi:hypothetical protein